MTQSKNTSENSEASDKKSWGAPILKRYGRVQELTAGGTLTGKEKEGMIGMMGEWKPGKMPG